MKKLFITWGFVAAALTLFSCAKQEASLQDAQPAKAGVPFELVAGVDTKTTAESLSTIKWAAGDAISVFHTEAKSTTYGTNDKFTIAEGDLATNTFKGELTDALNETNDWYAFYPYGSYINPNGTGYVSVGGNMNQDYTKPMAHLAGSKFPLYGKAEGVANGTSPSIAMKQAMSIVKVHVTNNSGAALDVNSVVFSTEDYEITGQFFINFEGNDPVFTPKDGNTGKSVTLSVSNSTPIADGASADYYIAVAPFDAASGKKLHITVNDLSKVITLSAAVSFLPGKIKTVNFSYDKAVTPAALPFAIDGTGGSAAYSSTNGLSSSGLGSNYDSKHSPYLTKFDSDDDYIQVFFDKPAYQVSFGVKKIGGATNSSFILSGSANGIDFTDIETFVVNGAQNAIVNFASSNAIDDSYRFLKLKFAKGANVGFGPLSISVFSSDPFISALDINDVPAAGVTAEDWTYSVENISDDVEVAEFTGCVSDAVVATPGAILYSVSPNYKTTAENGTIVLWSASNHAVTKTINVAQLKSSLSVSTLTVTIPASANTATFTVTSPDFGYDAVVASVEDGMNLTISSGASGSANASAQTVTVSSTSAAPTSGDAVVLGTINVYRNGNVSDSQNKTITIKKAVDTGSTAQYVKVNTVTSGKKYLFVNDGKAASSTGSGLNLSTVSITGTSIASDAIVDGYAITITSDGEGHYTLKMGEKFIGYASKTNLSEATTASSNSYKWTISFDSDGTAYIVNFATNTRFIGANNDNTQFKAYATSNKGTYAQPVLYEYTEE